MRASRRELAAGFLMVLGSMGLEPVTEPLWKAIAVLLPSTPIMAIILSLAADQHKPAGRQRVKQAEEMFNRLGFVTQIIRSAGLDAQKTPSLPQQADFVYTMGDDPRTLSTYVQANAPEWKALRQRHETGTAIIAAANIAAMLGEHTFAPLKPYPPMLDDLEFEPLPGAGLLPGAAILPYFNRLPDQLPRKLAALFPPETTLIGIDEQAALISDRAGWRAAGLGSVTILRHNQIAFVAQAGASIPTEVLLPYQ
ncbi:MAG: hypothetical protein JXB30_08445 [Anaerolineae bacterium]|nr:hypothetical protein [Anaerolineae bacterium]